jgi:hypothetical protein
MPQGMQRQPAAPSSPLRPMARCSIVCQPLGDGSGRAHQPAQGTGRRVGSRLEAQSASVVQAPKATRRNSATRTPTARAPCGTGSMPDAPLRRRGPPDAGAGRRRCNGAYPWPRCKPSTTRSIHKASGRSLGYGALAEAAAKLDVPQARDAEAEGPVQGLPLHRQAGHLPRRRRGHRHRQARNTASTRGCPACSTPWWRARRCSAARSSRSTAAEALKVPGVVKVFELGGHAGAIGVPAARRRRRRRQGHLGRDQGPRGAEDRLGRRPARQLRLHRVTAASWRQAVAKPGGKVVRDDGDASAALAKRRSA